MNEKEEVERLEHIQKKRLKWNSQGKKPYWHRRGRKRRQSTGAEDAKLNQRKRCKN